MFPGNFHVLKIPARSRLLSTNSWVSAIGATSATLAARGGCEGDFGRLGAGVCRGSVNAAVEILFRPANHQEIARILWERACSRRHFHSRHHRRRPLRIREQVRSHRFGVFTRLQPQPARRYWSSSRANDPSSDRLRSTPASPHRGTPARHPSPAATNG